MCIFFFKQKTAYEMRISDWSSDVCSSDLLTNRHRPRHLRGMTPPSSPPLQPDPHGFKRRGVLFVLSSPSGAGKSTIARRSEEHTSELQSLMRISYAVFCLKKKSTKQSKKQKTL